jgi:hypothetical protein
LAAVAFFLICTLSLPALPLGVSEAEDAEETEREDAGEAEADRDLKK